MAHHATVAVPRGNNTMRASPEHIVVRSRLGDTVARRAGLFRVAYAAGGIFLATEQTVAFGPRHIVAGGRLGTIHIDVARQAFLPGSMCVVADSNDIAALQLRHIDHLFGHDGGMAFLAFSSQGVCVDKDVAARCGGSRLPVGKRG